jgi:hypothetical protein
VLPVVYGVLHELSLAGDAARARGGHATHNAIVANSPQIAIVLNCLMGIYSIQKYDKALFA